MSAATPGFVQDVLPDARVASEQTNIPVSVILAQWINETDSGQSSAFRNQHNYAGVSLGGSVMTFSDRVAGLAAYIKRWGDPVYAQTRAGINQNGGVKGDPYKAAQVIEQSPWAAGHYNGNGLELLIAENNLSQYDSGPRVPIPPAVLAAEHQNGGQGPNPSGATDTSKNGDFYGCPEGKVWDGPSIGGTRIYITKCQGRAFVGAGALFAGVLFMALGLGVIALGSRAGQSATGAALGAAAKAA